MDKMISSTALPASPSETTPLLDKKTPQRSPGNEWVGLATPTFMRRRPPHTRVRTDGPQTAPDLFA